LEPPPDTLASLLSAAHPRSLAIADSARRGRTYGELCVLADRTRRNLAAHGVTPRDTVAAVFPNGPETASLLIALLSSCRAAPLNPALTQTELSFALRDLEPKAIVAADDQAAALRAARECGVPRLHLEESPLAPPPSAPAPDDIALLLHTSGTTARPKLVPLTQRNLVLSARGVAESLELTSADTCLSVMPLFHVHGLVAGLLAPLAAGSTACVPPGFKATSFFSWLESSEATWYTAVPAIHQAILARAHRNAAALGRHRLRLVRSCSSTLYPNVHEGLRAAFGVPVLNAYGMTEAAHQVSSVRLPGGGCATVGVSSGPEVAVVDDAGRLLGRGETGEVVLRGPQIMTGYLQPEGANRAAFHDGWFRTGDEGFLNSEGALTLVGRRKEMINCGGEKVSPHEVEETLLLHPAVEEVVAFAVPDTFLGEAVAAAVVLREGFEAGERELLRLASDRLSRRKIPGRIWFVDEIPRGASGKPQRIGMAERLGLVAAAMPK
jgi:acyl-CoA synthetase (AMP-forming)/AMP-acid ligase II